MCELRCGDLLWWHRVEFVSCHGRPLTFFFFADSQELDVILVEYSRT